jgi:glutathione synthase/RimK-type ligase-like ATP-grasp enzyme
MANKILIIAGGNKKKLDGFAEVIQRDQLQGVTLASFSSLNFESGGDYVLKINDTDVKEFDLIYIRMVGKRFEETSLLVNYAINNNIKIVDGVYLKDHFMPSSISKAVELSKLVANNISIPPTYFASVNKISQNAPAKFGYPFVIKSTSGRKARDAWAPQNEAELTELVVRLKEMEIKEGKKFFAQKFIPNSQRIRALVVGDRVIGAITRPTKWRKRLGEIEEKKEAVELSPELNRLALEATRAVDLNISGVDIMEDPNTQEAYILEVNAAPAWELIKKDSKVDVEAEVLRYLLSL